MIGLYDMGYKDFDENLFRLMKFPGACLDIMNLILTDYFENPTEEWKLFWFISNMFPRSCEKIYF